MSRCRNFFFPPHAMRGSFPEVGLLNKSPKHIRLYDTRLKQMVVSVGVDIGSQKSILVADDGEIVRTDTGSISVPTIVSFVHESRYVGDEAASYHSADGTISLVNLVVGRKRDTLSANSLFEHCSAKLKFNDKDDPIYEVPYCEQPTVFSAESVLAILIGEHAKRISEVHGPETRLVFVVPHGSTQLTQQSLLDAAQIAGVPTGVIDIVDEAEALVATYGRKISALRPADRQALHVRKKEVLDRLTAIF